jgi:ComF family protein
VWWLGNYNDILKTLIHDMKFQRKRAYAREFGTILAQALPYLHESTVVVSVPTASTRIRRRGYDQAALIAQSFARTRNLRYQNALVRTSQVDLIGKDRSSRLKQMASATELRIQASFKGQSILLIDDVLTTGASIEAAARLLRKNGAQHVDAAVVARHMLG